MFKKLFALRFGSASETQILEACEWDEERAAEVMDIFSEFLSICSKSRIVEKNAIAKKLKDNFGEALDEYESKALLEILDQSISNAAFLLDEDEKYEN